MKLFVVTMLYASLLLMGCPEVEDCRTDILVENTSNDDVFVFQFYNEDVLPQESLYEEVDDKNSYIIKSKSSGKIDCISVELLDVVDSIKIYIFLVEDLESNPWDSILSKNMFILKTLAANDFDLDLPEVVVRYP